MVFKASEDPQQRNETSCFFISFVVSRNFEVSVVSINIIDGNNRFVLVLFIQKPFTKGIYRSKRLNLFQRIDIRTELGIAMNRACYLLFLR